MHIQANLSEKHKNSTLELYSLGIGENAKSSKYTKTLNLLFKAQIFHRQLQTRQLLKWAITKKTAEINYIFKKNMMDWINQTCKQMLRNRSWASLMLKARSRLEEISLLWSFFTLLTKPSRPPRGRFFATTRRPQHGLGLAVILRPSMSDYYTIINPLHKEIQTLKRIMHIRTPKLQL